VVIATGGGALLLIAEAAIGYAVRPKALGLFLWAHVLAAAVASTLVALVTRGRSACRYTDRSNPFWPGVGYGMVATLAPWATVGLLAAPSWSEVVPAIGASLWFGALTFEIPAVCLFGALAWAVLGAPRRRERAV
jgi:hypothetical protein